MTGLIVGGLMLATACGSQAAVSPAAPATEAPATEVPEITEPAMVESVADTLPATTPVPVPPTTDTIATPTTLLDESSDTTVVMVGTTAPDVATEQVSITDPIPAQADAIADPTVAEAAVRYAYQHWILWDLDPVTRSHIIENGELNTAAIEAGLAAAFSIIEFAGMAVDEVSFTDAENAVVLFRVLWNGNPSPIFPDAMFGNAVYRDGYWRLGGGTLCRLAFGSGQDCSGVNGQNPTPPTAVQLTAVPSGYVWNAGSTPADVLSVPGGGNWSKGADSLLIMAEALTGISALAAEDADAVLRVNRFGVGATGIAQQVEGRPAVIREHDGGADLAYIRNDDVVVQMHATGLTGDELVALAVALVPVDVPITYTPPPGTPGRMQFSFCGLAATFAGDDRLGASSNMNGEIESYLALLRELTGAADLSEPDRQEYMDAVGAVIDSYDAFRSRGDEFTNKPAIDEINRICGTDYADFHMVS